MTGVRLVQILIMVIILGVVIYLLRLSRAVKLEKRIGKFAIANEEIDSELSLIDKGLEFIKKIIKLFSKILKKSVVLTKYGEKYNKYISFKNKDKIEGIDYVSLKFLIAIIVLGLSAITALFHKINLSFPVVILIFLISFFGIDIYFYIEFRKRRKKIEDDLLKAIIIMNNAFQSGRNIMQAIEVVKNELDGPIQDEFKKIYLDITYGLDLELVFDRFYERVKLEDAKYISSSLSLLNKTGGDIIKVFSLIEKSIFDKKNLKNELNSLTASSQFVFKMLICLPVLLIGVIFILNPTYFTPLFTTPLGILALVFTILLYILYILVIKRVLEVEL